MSIDKIFIDFDYINLSETDINKKKSTINNLSNSDKKYLKKIISQFRTEKKENVLKAIIFYAIWCPDESIEYCRQIGVFRHQIGRGKKSNSELYLEQLIKYKDFIKYSRDILEYLEMKKSCKWLYEFYVKTETKIKKKIEEHHNRRIRKNINGIKLESALFRELIVYMELIFTRGNCLVGSKPNDKNKYIAYSKEEIGEGISYLIYVYDSIIGIKEECHYWIDVNYIYSEDIEELILLACQFIQMQQWEVLIDYFGYKIIYNENKWKIIDNTDLERSIRMGYAHLEIHDRLFFLDKERDNEDICSLKEIANYMVEELGEKLFKKTGNGFMERYCIMFSEEVLSIIENKIGDTKFFREEINILEYMEQEMVTDLMDLREKKITNHVTLEDILLFQRFFVLTCYVYRGVLQNEQNKKVIAASIGPVFSYDKIYEIICRVINDKNKTKELLDIFIYNKNQKKLDLQYTPIIRVGNNLFCSLAIVAVSNMIRNVIAYSHMIKNQIVNNDGGLEPMVSLCEQSFMKSNGNFQVFTNKHFRYSKREGEIDLLVISDAYIIIIECKAPLRPTNNFEMRSEYEHILKAKKQLDLSKAAFSDKGFRKKYFQSMGIEEGNRKILTCILLGNRIFSGYKGCGHPIRSYYELDSVLRTGRIGGNLGKWKIWKDDKFSINDLIDFLSEEKSIIRVLEKGMEKRKEVLKWGGKQIEFETYTYNILKAYKAIDETYKCITKEEEWNKYMEEYQEFL